MNKNIYQGVIILLIGGVIGFLIATKSISDSSHVDTKSDKIKDSLINIINSYELVNDSLWIVNDSLSKRSLEIDSILSQSKVKDDEVRNEIMGGSADSAYSIILQHLPDGTITR